MRKNYATYPHITRVASFETLRFVFLFLLLFNLSSPNLLMAAGLSGVHTSDIPVKGRVIDKATGEPLSGVSVIIKGTNTGTTTDADGNFTIVAPDNGILEFTIVGYGTITQKANNSGVINIFLDRPDASMNEVVVVGYGTRTKRDVIGSIASVGARQLQDKG